MSETDEGSTEFELLEEFEPSAETAAKFSKANVTTAAMKSKQIKQKESLDQKSLIIKSKPSKRVVVASPDDDVVISSETPQSPQQVVPDVANAQAAATSTTTSTAAAAEEEDTGDFSTGQINAEMVWSGLQWGASFLSKVTEKAKESVDKVITTLDPQMKPIIFSGGDLSLIVASDKSSKVMPIQDAFWDVFGRATVEGVKAQPSSLAAQPVGFTAGLKAAEDRVACLHSVGDVDAQNPIIAVEGFLAELSADRWFEMSCVLLIDKMNNISLSVYTQATPLEEQWINQIKDGTPPDYPLSWCGFAKTIGEVASASYKCELEEWHEKHTGMPRCATIYQAAKTLAYLYKQKLEAKTLRTVIASQQPEVTSVVVSQ